MTEPHETFRREALTAFLETRVDEGFTIESRTPYSGDPWAPSRSWSMLAAFPQGKFCPAGQVARVDVDGKKGDDVAGRAAPQLTDYLLVDRR